MYFSQQTKMDIELPLLILYKIRTSRLSQNKEQQRSGRSAAKKRRVYLRNERKFPNRVNLLDLNEEEIKARYRLSSEAIQSLFEKVKENLNPKTERSHAIPGIVKLLCALHFFASGSFQNSVSTAGGITQSSFSRFLFQVIQAIVNLYKEYISFPNDPASLKAVKQSFLSIAGFPNVIGAIDCTHVALSPPSENEYIYRNEKHFHSLNMQVVVSNNMKIIDVVAKFPGSTEDSYILSQSGLHQRFENGEFGSGWLLGDSMYGLKPWLMTPVSNPKTRAEKKYNHAHSATRSIIDRTFGMLKTRFGCLDKSKGVLLYSPEKVCKIFFVCCILHNIAMNESDYIEVNEEYAQHEEINMEPFEDDTDEGGILREKLILEHFAG
uniref:Putative nuclease HARBI1 n=2 Tax=Xenopus tropicalis TaxID=8364 RepID=A0A803K734_XENTR